MACQHRFKLSRHISESGRKEQRCERCGTDQYMLEYQQAALTRSTRRELAPSVATTMTIGAHRTKKTTSGTTEYT
eukprot:1582775-Rhodomonas_salina.1